MPQSLLSLNWQPYKHLRKYPHMAPLDGAIWEKFILQRPGFFNQVAYDVHIGEGAPLYNTSDPTYKKMADRLAQKRIDVIGTKTDTLFICELKPIATVHAVTQASVYRLLFLRHFTSPLPIQPAVIHTNITPDAQAIADTTGVLLLSVNP